MANSKLNRYWVSWKSSNHIKKKCKKPPFDYWCSGTDGFGGYDPKDNPGGYDTLVAVIDAKSEEEIWKALAKYFPDYEERFCELRDSDYKPGSRFPGSKGKTSLYEKAR